MNCTILTVGTELLMGQIINTNTAFLSKELNKIGINVLYHYTVGDNPDRLVEVFKECYLKSDIIITTGGLGPTQDDLTKEIISGFFSKELVLHKPSYDKLLSFFNSTNRVMTDNNRKQAYFPVDSIILDNELGTAPGCLIEVNNKIIICLPGPPREMTNMFLKSVKPILHKKSEKIIESKILKFIGIGESTLESELEDLITNQSNPTLATYANVGEVSLRITASGSSMGNVDKLMQPVINEITHRLSKYIYSYNNEKLYEVVGKLLLENNITISLAESCTGGLLSSTLTSIAGISKVFDRCIVTYSNSAKTEELNVKEETLNKYGAVSEEVAIEMCKGLKEISKSNICLSITGIAGPTGETEEKPIGLVYIAADTNNDNTYCEKFNFHGDRDTIRNYAALRALNLVRKIILKEYII